MVDLLDEEEIEQRLDELGDWERDGDQIVKVFEFDDFSASMQFVNAVAGLAERYDHHPDIDIRWTTVSFTLCTHSAGGITAKDIDLAGRIDAIVDRLVQPA